MKKIKKVAKIIFLSIAGVLGITLISCMGYYFTVTHAVSLEKDKLENLEASSLQIYDRNGVRIIPSSQAYISVDNLNKYTIDAFVSAEDKRFYSHHGIDFLRVGGAIATNIKSRSFSQGASTISQQLIKNTHLSNEKTISRKLKEFKLTKQLEKNYEKDQILEMYLNNIYFGNGAYGIENASRHYFGKSASELTLAESAILAGTINAPSIYDIQNKTEKATERRNLILKLMKSQGKISASELESAVSEPVNLNLTKLSGSNFIYNEIIEEACRHLKKSENEIKNSGIKIFTYYDTKLSDQIFEQIESSYEMEDGIKAACIVTDNENNGIMAYVGGNTINSKHQPGSAIKPVLVFAPAIENGTISPATKIYDEEINIAGYSPENADKTFHGYVSAREALKYSYNIPAVKLLNELGISNAQSFAKKLGIEFSNQDNNLAIALGGFTNGITLNSLCDAYTCFANNGEFKKSQFISKIVKNKTEIYRDSKPRKSVMKDSTAYLITDILKDASKTGTAKRLKDLNFEIASKTGTVGASSGSKNTDAYNVSYTSAHTVLSYFGGREMSEKINGATYPSMLSKDVYNMIYADEKPANFTKPHSVEKAMISKSDYKKNIVSITTDSKDGLSEVFAKANMPSQKKLTLNAKIEVFNFENKKPIISFFISDGYSYKIFRKNEKAEEIISSASEQNDKIIKFEDKMAKSHEIYEYFVEFCEKSTGKTFKSNYVKLRTF